MKYMRQSPYYYLEGLEGQLTSFAQTYGCGTYGAGEYDEASCTTGSGSDGGGSDGLVDTGFGIILAVTIAAILIFATMVVIFMRRKKKITTSKNAKNVQSSTQQPVQKSDKNRYN